MHLGISETPTFIGTFKWRLLRMKLESLLKKDEEKLLHHINAEAIQLLDNSELVRRLKKKPFKLV
jgi:hypothetical protein